MINLTVIAETEERYNERKPERDATVRKIETKPMLEVDTPERVEKRMARLGFSEEDAKALSLGEVSTEEAPVPSGVTDLGAAAFERVLGRSDLLGVSYLERGLTVARAVARIRIRDDRGRIRGFGTGFLVSPRLLLTNNHVLGNAQVASFSQAEFNFQDDTRGRPLTTTIFDLDPQSFFLTDRALDYTLVAVRDNADANARRVTSFGWCQLIEAEGKILLGEYASIIQHPNGEAKQLAMRENQVIDLLEDFMHYKTDTSPGSSGSAVFNDQWEVVALHHSGVPERDSQGRILTTDKKIWTQAMGEGKIAWRANEGARISRVIKHIKNQNLTSAQRLLRSEIFEATPPVFNVFRNESLDETPTRPPRREPPAALGGFGAVAGPDGSVSWTIPVTLSVRVGALGGVTASADTGASGVSGATGVMGTSAATVTPVSAPPDDSVEQAELRAALAELEAAKGKTYFDEKKDKADRDAYYKELPTTLTPAKLYDNLGALLRKTHKNKPKYKPAQTVYPWVDLQPNLKLKSVYSGVEFDPQELINEDFRIDQERAARFREAVTTEAVVGAERMAEELDLLEAQLPYNCEHVVPQSWFGKREPMRGDIHHLFACESGCNSFRGNIPYFDFTDFEEAVREACGKRETNKFEPSAGKGAVARATLYFLLRYPGEINAVDSEYLPDRLKVLLKWHTANPVSQYEKHRNQAIFAAQGNRNPLIDFPQWAKKIDFTRGLGG
ncbi:MAG TPA: endonuclease [Pyrinomonadaceae bacterium]